MTIEFLFRQLPDKTKDEYWVYAEGLAFTLRGREHPDETRRHVYDANTLYFSGKGKEAREDVLNKPNIWAVYMPKKLI